MSQICTYRDGACLKLWLDLVIILHSWARYNFTKFGSWANNELLVTLATGGSISYSLTRPLHICGQMYISIWICFPAALPTSLVWHWGYLPTGLGQPAVAPNTGAKTQELVGGAIFSHREIAGTRWWPEAISWYDYFNPNLESTIILMG